MIDLQSSSTPLTIHLPADLIAELRVIAQEQDISLDELVQEALVAYAEPKTWDRTYQEWVQMQANTAVPATGLNGAQTATEKKLDESPV